MKRRELLRLMGRAALLGSAVLTPVGVALHRMARRSVRAPVDILARIRGRTRALDTDDLDQTHDLAG